MSHFCRFSIFAPSFFNASLDTPAGRKKKRDKLVERFHVGSFFFIIIIIVFFGLIFYSPEGETYLLGDFFLQFKLLRFGRLFVKGFFHFSYWMIFSLLFFFFSFGFVLKINCGGFIEPFLEGEGIVGLPFRDS